MTVQMDTHLLGEKMCWIRIRTLQRAEGANRFICIVSFCLHKQHWEGLYKYFTAHKTVHNPSLIL